MQEYADPVIDWLDGGRGLFGKKLYRDVTTMSKVATVSGLANTSSFDYSLVLYNPMAPT
jgi:hypothetical protein